MISIIDVFKKTRILVPEINSGVIVVEKEVCPSVREIAERFAKGYDISEHIRNTDSGERYDDDAIDEIPNPQYDAEFDDFYRAAEDFHEEQELKNKQLKEPEKQDVKDDKSEKVAE